MKYVIAKSKGKTRKKQLQYIPKRKKVKTTTNTKLPKVTYKSKNTTKTSVPKLTYKTKKPKTNNAPKIKFKTNTKNKIKYTTPKTPYVRRQDQSMPALEQLLEQGYDMVTFEARAVACPLCQQMNGTTWTLQEFLDTTEYVAPIFFHLHVNCLDEVRVWSSNFSLPTVYVDWTGRIR